MKFSLNFEEEIDLESNLLPNQIKDFHNEGDDFLSLNQKTIWSIAL